MLHEEQALRDRIADVMYRELSGKYGDFAVPTEAARAVIDDLGLTVERRVIEGFAPDGHVDQHRVVGRWMRRKHELG